MIALGTLVKFTEVAYVVRKPAHDSTWEAPVKGNFGAPGHFQEWADDLPAETGRFLSPTDGTNKNVLALPSQGSGVVIGLERKLAGKSVSGSHRSTMEGDDWEPGWFESVGKPIDLYVVKSELRGKAFYVPTEAIEVLS